MGRVNSNQIHAENSVDNNYIENEEITSAEGAH
jgi:hypothetical protein